MLSAIKVKLYYYTTSFIYFTIFMLEPHGTLSMSYVQGSIDYVLIIPQVFLKGETVLYFIGCGPQFNTTLEVFEAFSDALTITVDMYYTTPLVMFYLVQFIVEMLALRTKI